MKPFKVISHFLLWYIVAVSLHVAQAVSEASQFYLPPTTVILPPPPTPAYYTEQQNLEPAINKQSIAAARIPPDIKYWASWKINTTIIDAAGLPWYCYTYRQTHCRPLFHLPADWRSTDKPSTTIIKIKKKPKDEIDRNKQDDNSVRQNGLPNEDKDNGTGSDTGAGSGNNDNGNSQTNQQGSSRPTGRPNNKFINTDNLPEIYETTEEGTGTSVGTSGERGKGKGPLESPRSLDSDPSLVPTTTTPLSEDTQLPFAFFTTSRPTNIDGNETVDPSLIGSGKPYSTVLIQTPKAKESTTTLPTGDNNSEKETTELVFPTVIGIVTPISKFDQVPNLSVTTTSSSDQSESNTNINFDNGGIISINNGQIGIISQGPNGSRNGQDASTGNSFPGSNETDSSGKTDCKSCHLAEKVLMGSDNSTSMPTMIILPANTGANSGSNSGTGSNTGTGSGSDSSSGVSGSETITGTSNDSGTRTGSGTSTDFPIGSNTTPGSGSGFEDGTGRSGGGSTSSTGLNSTPNSAFGFGSVTDTFTGSGSDSFIGSNTTPGSAFGLGAGTGSHTGSDSENGSKTTPGSASGLGTGSGSDSAIGSNTTPASVSGLGGLTERTGSVSDSLIGSNTTPASASGSGAGTGQTGSGSDSTIGSNATSGSAFGLSGGNGNTASGTDSAIGSNTTPASAFGSGAGTGQTGSGSDSAIGSNTTPATASGSGAGTGRTGSGSGSGVASGGATESGTGYTTVDGFRPRSSPSLFTPTWTLDPGNTLVPLPDAPAYTYEPGRGYVQLTGTTPAGITLTNGLFVTNPSSRVTPNVGPFIDGSTTGTVSNTKSSVDSATSQSPANVGAPIDSPANSQGTTVLAPAGGFTTSRVASITPNPQERQNTDQSSLQGATNTGTLGGTSPSGPTSGMIEETSRFSPTGKPAIGILPGGSSASDQPTSQSWIGSPAGSGEDKTGGRDRAIDVGQIGDNTFVVSPGSSSLLPTTKVGVEQTDVYLKSTTSSNINNLVTQANNSETSLTTATDPTSNPNGATRSSQDSSQDGDGLPTERPDPVPRIGTDTEIFVNGTEVFPAYTVFGEPCKDECSKRGYSYTWCTKAVPSSVGTWSTTDYCTTESNTTPFGEKCSDSCEDRGEPYYWCHKVTTLWSFCTPEKLLERARAWRDAPRALPEAYTVHGEACKDECTRRGYSYTWCTKATPSSLGSWRHTDYCSVNPNMTSDGEICVEECGFRGYSYSWCLTATSWGYCTHPSFIDFLNRLRNETMESALGTKRRRTTTFTTTTTTTTTTERILTIEPTTEVDVELIEEPAIEALRFENGTSTLRGNEIGQESTSEEPPLKVGINFDIIEASVLNSDAYPKFYNLARGFTVFGESCIDECSYKDGYPYSWCHKFEPTSVGTWSKSDYCTSDHRVTHQGEDCIDECSKRGQAYFWCHKLTALWGFCTPKILLAHLDEE